jgi:hypothetical protein
MAPINSNCHQGGLLCPEFFRLSCSSPRRDRQTSNEQTDRTDRPRPLKSVCLNRHQLLTSGETKHHHQCIFVFPARCR